MQTRTSTLRALLKQGIVVSPGVYDGLSARMVQKMGFKAAATGGSGFSNAVDSEEQIKRFVDAVEVPVSINIGFGIRSRPTTPLIPIKRLAEFGVARVTMARMLPSAALMGMHKALALMRDLWCAKIRVTCY